MTVSTRITMQHLPADEVGAFISQYLAVSRNVTQDCRDFLACLDARTEKPVEAKPVRSVATILALMEVCLYLNDGSYGSFNGSLRIIPTGTESEMDELFYDKWVLRLLMRYAATFVSKDEFLSWCRLTMAQDIKDQPWNMGRALKMIEANFAKWEAFASSRQSASDPAARQA